MLTEASRLLEEGVVREPGGVDVGLILKGEPPAGRLEASGSFNAMFTHRVRVNSLSEVDAQLIAWLKQAYDGGHLVRGGGLSRNPDDAEYPLLGYRTEQSSRET